MTAPLSLREADARQIGWAAYHAWMSLAPFGDVWNDVVRHELRTPWTYEEALDVALGVCAALNRKDPPDPRTEDQIVADVARDHARKVTQ